MADNVFSVSDGAVAHFHEDGAALEVDSGSGQSNPLLNAVKAEDWKTINKYGLAGEELKFILDKVRQNPKDSSAFEKTVETYGVYCGTKASIKDKKAKATDGTTLDTRGWSNQAAAKSVQDSAKDPMTGANQRAVQASLHKAEPQSGATKRRHCVAEQPMQQQTRVQRSHAAAAHTSTTPRLAGSEKLIVEFILKYSVTQRKAEKYILLHGMPVSGDDFKRFVNVVGADSGNVDKWNRSDLDLRVQYGLNRDQYLHKAGTDKAKWATNIRANVIDAMGQPDEVGLPTKKYKTYALFDIEQGVIRAFSNPTPPAAETPVAPAPPPRPVEDTTPAPKGNGKRCLEAAFGAEDDNT